MGWGVYGTAYMGEMRIAYKIVVGNLKGKGQPERPKHRWEADMKMDFRELECENVNRIWISQDRV